MRLKNRVEKLEKMSGSGEGFTYFVHVRDDVYTLKANGAHVEKEVEMTQEQFVEWENKRGKNDTVYVIRIYGG